MSAVTDSSNQIRLCTGEVRHQRVRPVKNSFNYGVFFIRVPLRVATTLDVALFSRNRFNLVSFYDKDHGDGKQPLATWIDSLLKSEGVHDADGEIWLQCFPRVFGYVFNPVSFWFCHRRDGRLRAIVCEVRNTFGEKHIYVLENDGNLAFGSTLRTEKIFHVSPFCAVQGEYQFRFKRTDNASANQNIDTPNAQPVHVARIEYGDDDGPLLLTSISGKEQAMTTAALARVLLRYPLMTFGVVARIHWQALILFLKRVPFFPKPTPPEKEVSR